VTGIDMMKRIETRGEGGGDTMNAVAFSLLLARWSRMCCGEAGELYLVK